MSARSRPVGHPASSTQRTGYTARYAALFLAGLLAGNVSGFEPPVIREDDTLVIKADQAWETRTDGTRRLHFEGSFTLNARDWSVTADQAVVTGPVEDPDTIEVSGAPAHVRLRTDDAAEQVDAYADTIRYRRRDERLRLEGNAELVEQTNRLRSSFIEYDLSAGRLAATGPGGVEIVATPARETSVRNEPASGTEAFPAAPDEPAPAPP